VCDISKYCKLSVRTAGCGGWRHRWGAVTRRCGSPEQGWHLVTAVLGDAHCSSAHHDQGVCSAHCIGDDGGFSHSMDPLMLSAVSPSSTTRLLN